LGKNEEKALANKKWGKEQQWGMGGLKKCVEGIFARSVKGGSEKASFFLS